MKKRLITLPDRPCDICGIMFTPVMRSAKYCSKPCYHKSFYLKDTVWRNMPDDAKDEAVEALRYDIMHEEI